MSKGVDSRLWSFDKPTRDELRLKMCHRGHRGLHNLHVAWFWSMLSLFLSLYKSNIVTINKTFLCFFLLFLILVGIEVMIDTTVYIKKDKRIVNVHVDILVGIVNVFSLLGLTMAGWTSNWIGCHYTIMLMGAFFFIKTILMGFAPNNALLLVGSLLPKSASAWPSWSPPSTLWSTLLPYPVVISAS